MGIDESGKALASSTSALVEVVKIAKESPDARAAGTYAAKSLKIITQTVHTVLLPLAAANYGAARFENYIRERFQPELQERLADVPADAIQAPRAAVAGPTLDALVYAHEDDELRRMYLSLLASAMDARVSAAAHPAFVEVLRQIDSDEISYLRAVIGPAMACAPVMRLNVISEDGEGRSVVLTHLLDWQQGEEPHVPSNLRRMAAYIENWVRLGLIEVDYDLQLLEPGIYDWGARRPEFELLTARLESRGGYPTDLEAAPGVLTVTNWGREFARAVRIEDAPPGSALRELKVWSDEHDDLIDDFANGRA